MQPVQVDTIDGTRLWVHDGLAVRPARDNYLVSAFLLRSSIFIPNLARRTDGGTTAPRLHCDAVLSTDRTLDVRDLLLLGLAFQIYHRDGCPEHGYIPMTLTQAADAMGFTPAAGGRQRASARAGLERLWSAGLTWTELWADGLTIERRFRLVSEVVKVGDRSAGLPGAGLRLSRAAVEIAQHTALTSLRYETARAMVNADRYAARLWLFLESERIPEEFHYRLFSAGPGEEPDQTYGAPAIAELLAVDHWQRRDAACRVRSAIETIHAIDGARWQLRLEHGSAAGMYRLHVRRARRPRPELSTGRRGKAGATRGRRGTDRRTEGYGQTHRGVRTDAPPRRSPCKRRAFPTPTVMYLPLRMTVMYLTVSTTAPRSSVMERLKPSTTKTSART